ncbi:hypothetical protein [Niveibacterium sp. SC-1]|uniref:hypothetical protein n=1 Tax=Niveibacterium sp. SC-1 TaxID=3135646 RepID=UPI00311E0793
MATSPLSRDEYLAQLNDALQHDPHSRTGWHFAWAQPGDAAPASGIVQIPDNDPEAYEVMSAVMIRFAILNGTAPISEPPPAMR